MRLIDVEALIEFIENRYEITWKDDYEGGIKDACTDILEKISKMPTIEPERKKGKWNTYYHSDIDFSHSCNQCGYSAPYQRIGGKVFQKKWNFCPNCGADMQGDDHDL